MKLTAATLLLGLLLPCVSSFALAGADLERDSDTWSSHKNWRMVQTENVARIQQERRMREERGVQRLKQLKWQTGYIMPQHYRSDGYKAEYRDFNLPKPASNQQWYKINNDFILVDTANNSIIRILSY